MKLDNPIPKAIYIVTNEPFSINGIILQKTGTELKINIEETQKIGETQVFLTHDIAKSFVECKLAIFDYQKEANDKSETEAKKQKKAKTESVAQDENTNQA